MDISAKAAVAESTAKRIVAFDILRGLMLAIMLVDHIELYPSLFDLFSGRGRLFVSAAEGFFFLSGLLVGMVYKRRISRGMKFITQKMWIRAAELYVLAAITTLGYSLWSVTAGNTGIKYGLPNPVDWVHLIQQTLLLRFGFGWADFLMRFSILMFIAPAAFYLLKRGWWKLLLVLSIGVWFFRDQNFTAAWQLLFLGGMIVGFYWFQLRERYLALSRKTQTVLKRSILVSAGTTFALSWLGVYLLSYLNERPDSVSWSVSTFVGHVNVVNEGVWKYAEKWTLGPLRVVLFFLWISALFYLVQRYQTVISRVSHGVFELLGRNSLYVYLLHSLIVFSFRMYIPFKFTLWHNFVITALALVALIAGTRAYEKARQNYPHLSINSLYNALGRYTQAVSSRLLRKNLAADPENG